MNQPLDHMISLARSFLSSVNVTKDVNDKFLVDIKNVSWKNNRHDIMARSISGRGETIQDACSNFLNEARGKILFGNNSSYYGENPPEYLCLH